MSIPADVLAEIVAYFATNKKLNYGPTKNLLDRHKGFFVNRRAQTLANANPSWVTESGHTSLKARIDNEYKQLDTYLTAKATALAPGGTDLAPPHLDLHDVSRPTNATSASTVADNERTARARRSARIRAIGWRACGIHDNLWQASAGSTTATLQQKALDTLVDRRLRLIERMSYQVSRADALGGAWSFTGGGATGPWKDNFRVRMFEYPRISRNVVSQVAGFVGAANIASENDPRYQVGKPWQWEPGHHRLYYNVGPEPGNRFPTAEAGNWSLDSPNYWQQLKPTSTGAAAIDALFKPDPDWWGRAWLFCDQVLSSLNIEALLFGLRRRVQPPTDVAFNAIVTGHAAGYVALGAFPDGSPGTGTPHLMHDTADPYFENTSIDEADLQMGDWLVFWNSHIYTRIAAGEWKNEHSVVIEIDSDPVKGGIQRDRLHLQGHGTKEQVYGSYQSGIASELDLSLNLVRKAIAAAPSGTTKLDWNGLKGLLVKWEPYEPFNAPGAWWVSMEIADGGWNNFTEALDAVPGAVAFDAFASTGYSSPPSKTAIYFPLFRPNWPDGWDGYLGKRRHDPTWRGVPKNLVTYHADGSIVPGIHYSGRSSTPIDLIRPKVLP